jgi:hypothetical protein
MAYWPARRTRIKILQSEACESCGATIKVEKQKMPKRARYYEISYDYMHDGPVE